MLVALCLVGCHPKPAEPVIGILGDKAPVFTADKYKTLGQFIVGQWEVMGASGLGNSQNWREAAAGSQHGSGKRLEFKAEGSFTLVNGPYTFQGVWTDQGKVVALDYKMLNNKEIGAAVAQIREQASSGRQGDIASDIFIDWVQQELPKMAAVELSDNFRDLRFASDSSLKVQGLDLSGLSPTLVRLGPVETKE